MSDVKGLESAVIEAENRVKSLMERSNSLGGASEVVTGADDVTRAEGTVVESVSAGSQEKSNNNMLIIGGIAVVAVIGYLVLRKKK